MPSSAPHALRRDERLDWLRLIRSENVGPITFRRTYKSIINQQDRLARTTQVGPKTTHTDHAYYFWFEFSDGLVSLRNSAAKDCYLLVFRRSAERPSNPTALDDLTSLGNSAAKYSYL